MTTMNPTRVLHLQNMEEAIINRSLVQLVKERGETDCANQQCPMKSRCTAGETANREGNSLRQQFQLNGTIEEIRHHYKSMHSRHDAGHTLG